VSRTVDLVIAGGGDGAIAAAAEALRRGRRILVVLRADDARAGQRVRRRLQKAVHVRNGQLSVLTHAEVVCVDGVDGVEVVVIRQARTGRLSAVNTSAFRVFEGATRPDRQAWASCAVRTERPHARKA
jgi:thioredoxin reductase